MPKKRGSWEPTGYGGRLRELREAAGVTQAKLAELAGVTTNTVARMERGESEPAWALALAVADALGVGVERFRAVITPAEVEAVKARAAQRKPGRRRKGE